MTAQAHEFLYIDGEKRTMMSCPDFPVGSLGITEESEPGDGVWNTTACWRKYVGTWVLEDGDLYLKKIEGRYRLNEPGLLFAHWFSGTLIVPDGELLEYVHMGFGSQYEREIHITISEGSVTDTSIIDNRAKRAEREELAQQVSQQKSARRNGAIMATLLVIGPGLLFAVLPYNWWGITLKVVAAIVWASASLNLLSSTHARVLIYGNSGPGFIAASALLALGLSLDPGAWRTATLCAAVFFYATALMVIRALAQAAER
ncbi:TPA: hypothetical protein ACKQAS_002999 [Stenotrophomonas maltophilia]